MSQRSTIGGPSAAFTRRLVLRTAGLGAGAGVFGRALAALAADEPAVTAEMIRQAEWVAGLELTDADRELMLDGVGELVEDFRRLRAVELDNGVAPAVRFEPIATVGRPVPAAAASTGRSGAAPAGGDSEDLAFATISELGALLEAGRMTATGLLELALERFERYDPRLLAAITLTRERAAGQAAAADRELAAGRRRGPLHGLPWGAKDLLAVPGYPTTWGAKPYERQVREELATVVERLDEAGAVLTAKTAVGALAWGDVWFGGRTRNPWNPEQGSSGSSAGSAAAVAAGLVPFALGTETLGSILSPATRCGVTGLRPTFGRVSRHGAMALAWSMDKIGPLAHSAEDCGQVLAAIAGADPSDPSSRDRPYPFPWPGDPGRIRVGYLPALFEEDRGDGIEDAAGRARAREWQAHDLRTVGEIRALGYELVPLELPSAYPIGPLRVILTAEAATAFDRLTRSGDDDLLVRQVEHAWPNVFRQGQLIPAVEYLRANRVRTLVQRETEALFEKVDVYLAPTYGGDNLLLTNLTGHPQVVVPNGFRAADGTPTSITFTGRLWGESEMVAVAVAYQRSTDYHRRRPPLERLLAAEEPPGPGGAD